LNESVQISGLSPLIYLHLRF